MKKLDYGFTNDQVKTVTGEYLQFLKDQLLDVESEQDGWIEDSTTQLDNLRDNLNAGDINVETYDGYMENLRTSWKAKADQEINLDSASRLNALADSIDDYKVRLSKKIPSTNALNLKIQDFLSTYKNKVVEVANYLGESDDNVETLKTEVKDQIDKIVDDNKEFGKDKEDEAIAGLNQMKKLANTTLFKSLNEDNLKFILHSAVADGIEDVDRLEDPSKPSNFIFERDEMKAFALRVIGMVKSMTENGEKISWNMRTKEAQKMLDGGSEMVQASSQDGKNLNLERMQDKLIDLNEAAKVAIESQDVKTKLTDLVNDTVKYEKINAEFDTSGVKNTELYDFLTKEINETTLSTPARILHSLNKSELKAAGKLSRKDRDTLKFIRALLQEWENSSHNSKLSSQKMRSALQVLTGASSRNLKLSHKFDIGAAVNKFKAIYTQMTGKVDNGIETSNKLTGTIDNGQGRLKSLTKHLNISTLVGTEKSGFGKLFSFLPWVKDTPDDQKRMLMNLSSFTTMKDKLMEAHANAKKMTQEVSSAREFTKKFEDGFEILKKFS